ncbi:MAG TPA: DNA mismatch repair protein MutS [Thermoplasmata archaeon]|nr:DNA mismatch repair protein MutS [Thermoplasmata archaeon]
MSASAPSTPLMEQYEGVKARYPGHLVLFRVGDFFETFGDDAKLMSELLEVVLTSRGPDSQGIRVPMAGVPYHAVETYLGRLVQKGYKVALCDQVEDARLSKGLVRRAVTRVVTPGTIVEERILPGADHNFLAALSFPAGGRASFAAVDVSTGEWFRGDASRAGAPGAIAALAPFAPRELLLRSEAPTTVTEGLRAAIVREFPRVRIELAGTAPGIAEIPPELPAEILSGANEADRLLASYVAASQPRLLPNLSLGDREIRGSVGLLLDTKTLRHLEIARPMNPEDPDGPTLLSTLDRTVTASGHRTLSYWLTNPLADVAAISARQDAVAWLTARGVELEALRRSLSGIGDLARIGARLSSRRIRPPELAQLTKSLALVERARARLAPVDDRPALLTEIHQALDPLPTLSELLTKALSDDPPPRPEDPGLFRPGYAEELDRARSEEREGLDDLGRLERSEQEASEIRSLKIGFNQVFGYYFEISKANLGRVPPHLRRKQTLSGGERFTSDALDEIEGRILRAREALRASEAALWERLLAEADRQVPALNQVARAVGRLDALASFAQVAVERGHVRPTVDRSRILQIRDGRHPILESGIPGGFVPNDVDLDGESSRLLVLTGPNMSGKSTYMRQVGLFVVLAQAGAFVPAKFARIGLVSSLFTRMGFTDDIGRGKSSFMVEMSEVAEILEGADDRSVVLLDEVGRGTSTFDGLALAWATLKHLHDAVRCRTVLATHYHQLTELVERLAGARNAHLAVRETEGEVVFLHRLVQGSTDRSYGLHVARLAGLPDPLLEEARRLLKRLEEGGASPGSPTARRAPGSRYTQAVLLPTESTPTPSPILEELGRLDPDSMSPLDALRWIVEARRRLSETPPAERP